MYKIKASDAWYKKAAEGEGDYDISAGFPTPFPAPYKEGDQSRAVCHVCKKTIGTTFKIRDHEVEGVLIKAILVAVCGSCDTVVAIPHQSVNEIKRQRG